MTSHGDESVATRYQCNRCGASSTLEQLFVADGQPKRGNKRTCVTCALYKERVSGVVKSVFGSIALGMIWGAAMTESTAGTAAFVVAMPLYTFFGIAIHELGHAAAAKLVGARVVALSFGSGLNMKVVRRKGRFYLFGPRPIEGMTLVSDVPKHGYRWRMILIFVAGPAVNILAAAIVWHVYLTTHFDSVTVDVLVFFLAFINSLMGVINLLPLRTSSQFGPADSDGRQIMTHLRMSTEDIDTAEEHATIGEAYLEWLYGDSARAAELLQDALARTPLDQDIAITGSAVMLDLGRYADGIAICEQALSQEIRTDAKAALENNLACLLLKQEGDTDLPRIDQLTKSAMDVMPVILAVRATRGGYYLKAGEYLEAINLLDDERFKLESKETQGRVATDLALALINLDELDDARKTLDRAKQLYPDFEEISDVEETMRRKLQA